MEQSKISILVITVLVVGGLGWYLSTDKDSGKELSNGSMETMMSSENEMGDGMMAEKKEFTVTATNFAYSVKEIRVKKGDTVKINFVNAEGFHDWVLDEFNAKTGKLTAGGTESVEFVADTSGTFEYYCSVGTHRQMGMVGKLVVE